MALKEGTEVKRGGLHAPEKDVFLPDIHPLKLSNGTESKWRDFCIVMTILNGFLLLFVISVTIVWKQEVNTLTEGETSSLCLPCDQIRLHKDDDSSNLKTFTVKVENGVDICCGDNEEELDKLLDLFTERQYRTERANESSIPNCLSSLHSTTDNNNKPVARISGIVRTQRDYNSYKMHWDEAFDESFVGPYIRYREGEFVIQTSGYYHVYSQVTFSIKEETEGQSSTRHWIYRRKNRAPKHSQSSLIHSATSKCSLKSSERSRSSSYVGSVVFLERGDEIGVRITEDNLATSTSSDNFFGLHII